MTGLYPQWKHPDCDTCYCFDAIRSVTGTEALTETVMILTRQVADTEKLMSDDRRLYEEQLNRLKRTNVVLTEMNGGLIDANGDLTNRLRSAERRLETVEKRLEKLRVVALDRKSKIADLESELRDRRGVLSRNEDLEKAVEALGAALAEALAERGESK